jgi:hypothetical protein
MKWPPRSKKTIGWKPYSRITLHRFASQILHWRVPVPASVALIGSTNTKLTWIMHARSFCATEIPCYQRVSHQVKVPIRTLLIRVC